MFKRISSMIRRVFSLFVSDYDNNNNKLNMTTITINIIQVILHSKQKIINKYFTNYGRNVL